MHADEDDGPGLVGLVNFRQVAYRLFSTMMLSPEEERIKAVRAAAAEMERDSEAASGLYIFGQWKLLLAALAGLETSQPTKLQEQYVRVFLHHPDCAPCLPYESVYVDPDRQAVGWVPTMVEQEYAAAGLALSPSLKDLPDHAAVELEFMAFLCQQEAEAWEGEDLAAGIRALERQASFLRRHLNRWLPQWARQVVAVDGDGIYSLVAATASGFANHDADLADALLRRLRGSGEFAGVKRDGDTWNMLEQL